MARGTGPTGRGPAPARGSPAIPRTARRVALGAALGGGLCAALGAALRAGLPPTGPARGAAPGEGPGRRPGAGRTAPIAEVAIDRAGPDAPLEVTVVVAPNVALPTGPGIEAGGRDGPGVELAWRRCLPGACAARGPARDVVERWRSAEAGRIAYGIADGRAVEIPLSWRGLAQALDALGRGAT